MAQERRGLARGARASTLGIVGYGHIGSQVSILAEAMGMRVQYLRRRSNKLPLGNANQDRARWKTLLTQSSDVVTLHVPDTETTKRAHRQGD